KRFGFRDSFTGAAKTKEPEEDAISAIDVVEISSKRVVLPSPKEALTPIHLRRQPQAWSRDSKHIALSFQTGPADVDNEDLRMEWKGVCRGLMAAGSHWQAHRGGTGGAIESARFAREHTSEACL